MSVHWIGSLKNWPWQASKLERSKIATVTFEWSLKLKLSTWTFSGWRRLISWLIGIIVLRKEKKNISISLFEYWEHFETTEISTNLLTNRKYFNTFHSYGTLFPFLLTNLHYFFRTLKLQKTSFDLCVTRLSQLNFVFKLLVLPLAQLICLSTHKRMNFFEVFN